MASFFYESSWGVSFGSVKENIDLRGWFEIYYGELNVNIKKTWKCILCCFSVYNVIKANAFATVILICDFIYWLQSEDKKVLYIFFGPEFVNGVVWVMIMGTMSLIVTYSTHCQYLIIQKNWTTNTIKSSGKILLFKQFSLYTQNYLFCISLQFNIEIGWEGKRLIFPGKKNVFLEVLRKKNLYS